MIVPEIQFGELIDTIPAYEISPGNQSLRLTYGWGTHETMLNEIQQRQKNQSTLYPLVWWTMPYTYARSRTSVWVDNVRIILAVNTLADPLNVERYNLTFRTYLFPYATLIVDQALVLANNISPEPIGERNNEQIFANVDVYPRLGRLNSFDNNTENFAADYWDALIITFRARFTQNCLNVTQNQYNTEIITQWPYN